MMKRRDACKFLLDRISCGAIRLTCLGQRKSDVDVVRNEGLCLAGLAHGVLRPHADFRATVARVPRRSYKLAANPANRRCRIGARFFLAAGRANEHGPQREKYKTLWKRKLRRVSAQRVR